MKTTILKYDFPHKKADNMKLSSVFSESQYFINSSDDSLAC